MIKLLDPSELKYIVIHCSDSPQWRGDNATTIHKWHTERGFDAIGYHYVILESGIYQQGRMHYMQGAHTKGYNDVSLGICLIGTDYFYSKQYQTLNILCESIKKQHGELEIVGHRDLNPRKTCPGFDVKKFVESIFILN